MLEVQYIFILLWFASVLQHHFEEKGGKNHFSPF